MKMSIKNLKETLNNIKYADKILDKNNIKRYPEDGINLFDIYCKSDEAR